MAPKILLKNPKRWGINRLSKNIAVGLFLQPDTAGGRSPGRPPTVEKSTIGELRSTGRSTKVFQRAKLFGQLTARSTGPGPGQRAQVCARRSTGPVDRLWIPVDRPVDRQSLAAMVLGQKTRLKVILKNP